MSKQATAQIVKIVMPPTGAVYHVFYSNGHIDHIHARTQPHRFDATRRFILRHEWYAYKLMGGDSQFSIKVPLPTLAESFADAAVKALGRILPEDAALYESWAADEESYVYRHPGATNYLSGHLRRAIVYRWTARTLMSGKVDRAALVTALEGYEL